MTKLTFLGTGTSQGVPIIGCNCAVCRSSDPRDKRFRSSALIETRGMKILIDAGPDFRSQMLREGVTHLDAIFLTHNHLDHTGGLDDTRGFNYIDRKVVNIYCEPSVLRSLKQTYAYAFAEEKYPGAPEWCIHLIDEHPFQVTPAPEGDLTWIHDVGYAIVHADGSITPTKGTEIVDHRTAPASAEAGLPQNRREGSCEGVLSADRATLGNVRGGTACGGAGSAGVREGIPSPLPNEGCGSPASAEAATEETITVTPIRGFHDKMPVLGFRIGDIAYITDMSSIPESEFEKLKGLKHLTLNTVGRKPHHSHFSLEQAIEIARRTGAEHTWLTHLSHSFPVYEEFCKELPEGIAPAYDGLTIKD